MSDQNDKLPDLLPCPFCGAAVELERAADTRSEMYGVRQWWGVVCRSTRNLGGSCAIEQRPSASPAAAVERWNRRATPAPQAAPSDDALAKTFETAMELAAQACDIKYRARVASGHPREASTARALAEEIRSLAAAPAVAITQAATSEPTALSERLRAKATQPFGPGDHALLVQAADEIERYYGGMLNWKATAQAKDAAHLAGTTPNTEAPSEESMSAIDVEQLQARLDALLDYPEGSIGAALEEKCFLSWREKHVNRPGWEDTDLFIYRKGLVDGKRAALSAQQAGVQEAPSEDAALLKALRQARVALRRVKRAENEHRESHRLAAAAEKKATAAIDRAALAAATQTEKK